MITIEQSILKSLLHDEKYANKVIAYLEEDYFSDTSQTFFSAYKTLYDKYNKIPTLSAIAVTLQNYSLNEEEFKRVGELVAVVSIKEDLPDTQWLVDETEEYCRDKAIYDAVFRSLNIIDGIDKQLDKFSIPDMLEDALSISFDNEVGSDYFDDAEKRFDHYTSDDARLKFPLDCLNYLSNGGHKKKALSCVLGTTNTGKSAIMCYLAGEFMKMNKNVLYISMEMSEEDVQERIDANLLDVRTDDIKKLSKEEFIKRVHDIKKRSLGGRLVVKEYPTGTGTAAHFKQLTKELKQKKKFEPDIIFVDYLGICASSRYKNNGSVNSYSYQKAIAEELRGLAMELDCAMMTGAQINRGGASSTSPEMTDVSDSFGIVMALDFFFALTTDEVLQENGQQLMHLLKTRWGNKAKIKHQLVNIDFDKMRYTDIKHTTNTLESTDRQPDRQKKATSGIDFDV